MTPAERDAVIEECAKVAEAADRTGPEWVRDSLWDHMRLQTAADIRALKSTTAHVTETGG
jgi:hypothetical protein